jgi:hypothetical protein
MTVPDLSSGFMTPWGMSLSLCIILDQIRFLRFYMKH